MTLLNEQDFKIHLDLCILFLINISVTPTAAISPIAYNVTIVVSLVSDDLLAGLTSCFTIPARNSVNPFHPFPDDC